MAGWHAACAGVRGRRCLLLWTIIAILLILWLLGGFVIPTGGALIHVLLVIALIVLVYQLLTGRRVA